MPGLRGKRRTKKVDGAAILLACAVLCSCAAAPPPVTDVALAAIEATPEPPGVDPLMPEERLLALLTADNPRIEEVAMSLARLGGEPTRREAGLRLVALARAAEARARAEATEGAAATPREKDAMEARQTEAMEPLLAAMSHVGGSAVVAYCFALAEDESVPWERRELALRALHLAIPDEDKAAHERRARLSARLSPSRGAINVAGPVEAAAYFRRVARGCVHLAQKDDSKLPVEMRLNVHVARSGRTSSWAEGTAPQALQACLTQAASRLYTTSGADFELTMPIAIVPQ